MMFGLGFSGSLLKTFERLIEMGVVPVSRSTKRAKASGFL